MKLSKRLAAGIFAMTMAFSVAGCGSSDSSGEESGERAGLDVDPETMELVEQMKDDPRLPASLDNTNIKWLAHYDANPTNGSVKGAGLKLFEEKYGGTIEYIHAEWDDRYTKLANLVMSQDSPDFFPADDMDTFPKGAIKAMFQPIDDVIDLNSELWKNSKPFCDQFMFNGKHYIAVIKPSPNFVCVYNKRTIEDNNLDDPAELFENDEWTWDKFYDMCVEFTNAEQEKYGLDGYWYGNALSQTSGVPLIGLKDGKIVQNMSDPAIAKVQDWMYKLEKNDVCFDRSSNNWSTRGSGETGDGLGSYLTLFIPTGLWAVEGDPEAVKLIGKVTEDENEIMFVPMPRDPDGDTYYMGSRVNGYNICTGAPNPQGVAAYLDCIQVMDEHSDEIYERTLRDTYLWTDEMIEMRKTCYDLCAQNPVFDFQNGVSPELDAAMMDVSQYTMITGGGAKTWTECVGEYEKKVQWLCDQANQNVATEPTK